MTRLHSSLFCALSMVALATGCASGEKVDEEPTNTCDEDKLGDDCTCSGKREGVYECDSNDELECVCDPVEEDDDEDDDSQGDDDTTNEDDDVEDDDDDTAPMATRDASTKADTGTAAKPDASKPSSPPDAGSSGGNDAGGDDGPDVMTAGEPKIPEIKGTCPEFKNGSTIMVAGHRSIEIRAGAAGMKGPIVFYWHGTGSRASESSRFAGNAEVVAMGGIVASFNGSQSSKAAGDCSGTGAHNIADFDAADQIVACAVKNHGADPKRIYATGCSAGGLQSGCMAQKRSSYMAAVAPNSGGVVFPQQWQDKNSPAVFSMHGGSSDVVIVTFSQTSETFNKSAKMHGSTVVNCNHGGGHCLAPAALQQAAWRFMKDNPFGATNSPWKTALPSGTPEYCKIY